MKKKYMKFIVVGVLVIAIVIVFLVFRKKDIMIESIKKFNFFYDTGWAIDTNARYSIKCTDKCIAIIKPNNISEEEMLEKEVDDDFINQLIGILNKYKVSRWDGFNKVDKMVLDGNSFSLSVSFNDDKHISAHGYMKWPKNYSEVKSELDTLFMDI